jgi:hypothetical protein
MTATSAADLRSRPLQQNIIATSGEGGTVVSLLLKQIHKTSQVQCANKPFVANPTNRGVISVLHLLVMRRVRSCPSGPTASTIVLRCYALSFPHPSAASSLLRLPIALCCLRTTCCCHYSIPSLHNHQHLCIVQTPQLSKRLSCLSPAGDEVD